MKIKVVFAAIALFALASAFTTRTLVVKNYQFLSEESTRFRVNPTELMPGTNSGEYTCNFSLQKCVVNSEVAPTQDIDGEWYISKSASPAPSTTQGTIVIH